MKAKKPSNKSGGKILAVARGHLKIKPSFSLPDKKSYDRRKEKAKIKETLETAV
jgi:hypothetical protein